MRISDWSSDVCSSDLEHFPVAGVFNIARGAKRHVDVVTVTISEDGHIGRGEATAIYYHHETAASVEAQVESIRAAIERGDRKSTRCTPVTNAHLVCRLLLEKKKITKYRRQILTLRE